MKFALALVLMIGAGVIGYYFGYDHGFERAVEATLQTGEIPNDGARYMDIESYVRNSISALSPVKEVLGGTFYVTEIETDNGVGVVHYEDGHIALIADFTYEVDASGKPSITSFKVRE